MVFVKAPRNDEPGEQASRKPRATKDYAFAFVFGEPARSSPCAQRSRNTNHE